MVHVNSTSPICTNRENHTQVKVRQACELLAGLSLVAICGWYWYVDLQSHATHMISLDEELLEVLSATCLEYLPIEFIHDVLELAREILHDPVEPIAPGLLTITFGSSVVLKAKSIPVDIITHLLVVINQILGTL
jgi:hypothetical protein